MTETGKYGKEIGALRARDQRKLPEPERGTVRRKPRQRQRKDYGFTFDYGIEVAGIWRRGTKGCVTWFETAAQRDQAMKDFKKHMRSRKMDDWYINIRAIDRTCKPPTSSK